MRTAIHGHWRVKLAILSKKHESRVCAHSHTQPLSGAHTRPQPLERCTPVHSHWRVEMSDLAGNMLVLVHMLAHSHWKGTHPSTAIGDSVLSVSTWIPVQSRCLVRNRRNHLFLAVEAVFQVYCFNTATAVWLGEREGFHSEVILLF